MNAHTPVERVDFELVETFFDAFSGSQMGIG
jgi:hypothetical protein